jgi:DNA-binding response OmpR family regulator
MTDEYVAVPLERFEAVEDRRRGAPGSPEGGLAVRGFGVYVGIEGSAERAAAINIAALVADVQRVLTGVPGARTFASVVLAPEGTPAPALDVVRTALAEPSLAATVATAGSAASARAGVVVDLARHRLTVDGEVVTLRYREHVLLRHLVRHRGEVLDRGALQAALLAEGADEVLDRTIDVYLQRLRRRLGPYDEIIRTVRGRGYRLDPHPELRVVSG